MELVIMLITHDDCTFHFMFSGALDRKREHQGPKEVRIFAFQPQKIYSMVLLVLVDADYKFTYRGMGCNGAGSDAGMSADTAKEDHRGRDHWVS